MLTPYKLDCMGKSPTGTTFWGGFIFWPTRNKIPLLNYVFLVSYIKSSTFGTPMEIEGFERASFLHEGVMWGMFMASVKGITNVLDILEIASASQLGIKSFRDSLCTIENHLISSKHSDGKKLLKIKNRNNRIARCLNEVQCRYSFSEAPHEVTSYYKEQFMPAGVIDLKNVYPIVLIKSKALFETLVDMII